MTTESEIASIWRFCDRNKMTLDHYYTVLSLRRRVARDLETVAQVEAQMRAITKWRAECDDERAWPNQCTINVTCLDSRDAGQAIVDALREYERRNGPGWRS